MQRWRNDVVKGVRRMLEDRRCCTVAELRRYRLLPGQRDVLIDLFEQHFVEGQEAVGMHVIGTFRDLDDPNKFIWLRGFRSMEERHQALSEFYYGPLWRAHREAANATMADSDDVLLLTPASLGLRPAHSEPGEVAQPAAEWPDVVYTIEVVADSRPPSEALDWWHREELPARSAAAKPACGLFASLDAANTFDALPVRTDFAGVVCVTRHPTEAHARAHADAVEGTGSTMVHVLRPTGRSRLR
jgi:hypothetical protein